MITLPPTYTDYDPETQISGPATGSFADAPVAVEMEDGIGWELTTGTFYGVSVGGHVVHRVVGGQLASDGSNANVALSSFTYYAVYAGQGVASSMAQNSDTLVWQIGPWTANPAMLAAYIDDPEAASTGWDQGKLVVLAWTFDFALNKSDFYINGDFAYTFDFAPGSTLGGASPTLLPEGDIYRAFVLPVVQDAGDITSLSHALFDEYLNATATIAWDPSVYDGDSPVTSYLLRVLDGTGEVAEYRVLANADPLVEVNYIPPATVQIMARNQVGLSASVEMALS